MNITVLYNKPTRRALTSPFRDTEDDTADSAAEVVAALQSRGENVSLVAVDENHLDEIKNIHADVLFNLVEWTGLDLPLSDRAFALIERLHIPVAGATRENFLATSDKTSMKKALDEKGLPTARWQVFITGQEIIRADFSYPVIVKLALEHCSIGLTHDAVVHNARELAIRIKERVNHFREPIIAEEFIAGREFQVTAVDLESGLRVLPPAEIVYTTPGPESLLTYESRWEENSADYHASKVKLAELDPSLMRAITDITIDTFQQLGFRDYLRLDIRLRGTDVIILEANSNPGLSDSDEYGMTVSYKAVGWTFADFVWKIVESAMRRTIRNRRG